MLIFESSSSASDHSEPAHVFVPDSQTILAENTDHSETVSTISETSNEEVTVIMPPIDFSDTAVEPSGNAGNAEAPTYSMASSLRAVCEKQAAMCPVCLDMPLNPVKLHSWKKVHVICSICWNNWKESSGKSICPVCRQECENVCYICGSENYIKIPPHDRDYERRLFQIVACSEGCRPTSGNYKKICYPCLRAKWSEGAKDCQFCLNPLPTGYGIWLAFLGR